MPRVTASLGAMRAAVVGVLRNLPLFFAERPRTPLRVMCIMAFDALQILRHVKPLSQARRQTLAALLDFGASLNARFDRKKPSSGELRAARALLDDAGVHDSVDDYARRLAAIETGRPDPGGEESRFHAVHAYRESVVRLSLGMLAAAANLEKTLDEGIEATVSNPDLNVLFRIVMFCQIIDDAIDYPLDESAKLPSFLTACGRLPQSLTLTRTAAREYAALPRSRPSALPLRLALRLTGGCVKVAVLLRCGGSVHEALEQSRQRDHDVRRLQVAVNDSFLVSRLEPLCDPAADLMSRKKWAINTRSHTTPRIPQAIRHFVASRLRLTSRG